MNDRMLNLLMEVGFSNLEATIYVTLLREPGVTGYRVAKILGKPVPNTYKALDSLKKKGAIIADETSKSLQFTPLPIEDYLDQLEYSFKSRRKEIEQELAGLYKTPDSDSIYNLENMELVLSKTNSMIEDAEKIIIIQGSEKLIESFSSDLEKAQEKDVVVLKKIITSKENSIQKNVNWMILACDKTEFLYVITRKSDNGLLQAYWSRNEFFAPVVMSGLLCEQVLSELKMIADSQEEMSIPKNKLDNIIALYEMN